MPVGFIVQRALFLFNIYEMFVRYNPNPDGLIVGDCVIRAITAIEKRSWRDTYIDIAATGLRLSDMPTANRVWGAYLRQRGYSRHPLPDTCPDCYTVSDFCRDYPDGKYLVATGSHVVAVIDGNYYDAWDSGKEVPSYYWSKDV